MPNLSLNTKNVEVLKVDIDGTTYTIPLGTSLTRKQLAKLDKEENVYKFLGEHLGDELVDNLPVKALRQIIEAWAKATEEANGKGVTLGE